jgi:hypothetical protein
MKIAIKIILIAALAYLAELFFPWWSVVVAAFLINAIIYTKGGSSFLSGFLGIGLLWLIIGWNIDAANASLLSSKVSQVLRVNSTIALLALTFIVGGLAGGFGALAGSHFKNLIKKKKDQFYYN